MVMISLDYGYDHNAQRINGCCSVGTSDFQSAKYFFGNGEEPLDWRTRCWSM